MSKIAKVAYFPENPDSGECELVGPENFLIPEGLYEASYLHFETGPLYSKRINNNKSMRQGGKLYIWFWIDPYGNKLGNDERTELYRSYNTKAVTLPVGKGKQFSVTRKGNYYKDYKRHFGVARGDRISPNAFKNQIWEVEVGTVATNDRQRKHAAEDRYSIIQSIIRKVE